MNLIEGIQAECNRIRDVAIPRYSSLPGGAGRSETMKEGDLVRNKNNHFTGRIGGTQTRLVDGKPLIERVLIIAERRPGARLWCDVADVELVTAEPPA